MSGASTNFKRQAAAAALAVAALLVALLLASPQALGRGWLVAFSIGSDFCVGSLVLLMIHRLTGGTWGEALAPVLRPTALLIPGLVLAFVPIALALPDIYPWANDPGAIAPSIARGYLNPTLFLLRAGIALIGWSLLALAFGRGQGGRLLAALGLIFYVATIGSVATDWFLSLAPGYVSSAFAAMTAIQQLLTALALAALLAPAGLPRAAVRQIAAYLIATILGVVYLGLMTFIVDWYGDLPAKAAWYLARGSDGWPLAIVVSILLAAAAIALLLVEDARRSQMAVRCAAVLALAAVCLHTAWLLVPAFTDQARVLIGAIASLIALGALASIGLMQLAGQGETTDARGTAIPRHRAHAVASELLWGGVLGVLVALASAILNRKMAPRRSAHVRPHPAPPMTDQLAPETPAVAGRRVLAVTFGFLALVAASGTGLYFYLGSQVRGALITAPRQFPQPRLEFDAPRERARAEAEQRQRLSAYEWVDRDRGVIRIPIDRAAELIVGRGAGALDPLESSPPETGRNGGGPP